MMTEGARFVMKVGPLTEFLPCRCKPDFDRPGDVEDYYKHAEVCARFREAHPECVRPTKEAPISLAALRQVIEKATPGKRDAFQLGNDDCSREATAEEQKVYVARCIDFNSGPFYVVGVDKPDGRADLCHTGNGPTSWANAQQIAALDRETALALVAVAEAAMQWRDDIDNPLVSSKEQAISRNALRAALARMRP